MAKSISRTASKLSEMERSIGNMINRLGSLEDEEKYAVGDVLKECREILKASTIKLRKHLHKQTDSILTKLLTSIPGIGTTIADILIAEIGSIDRFYSKRLLLRLPVLIQELSKVELH